MRLDLQKTESTTREKIADERTENARAGTTSGEAGSWLCPAVEPGNVPRAFSCDAVLTACNLVADSGTYLLHPHVPHFPNESEQLGNRPAELPGRRSLLSYTGTRPGVTMFISRLAPVVVYVRAQTAILVAGVFIGALIHGCNPECLMGTRLVGGKCVAITTDGGTAGSGTNASSVEASNAGSTSPAAGASGNVQSVATAGTSSGVTAGSGAGSVNATSKPGNQGGASAGTTTSTPGASANGASGSGASNPPTSPQTSQTAGTGSTPMSSCNPVAEECDGMDNDCDGKVDEGIDPRPCGGPTAGVGICTKGMQSCSAGQWGECVGETLPAKELCDDKMQDEDCDGVVDNGCPCTTGQTRPCMNPPSCKPGMQTCTNGVWDSQCAGEVRGSTEVCDGMDNDCNGAVDDGGNALCSGGQKCGGTLKCVECMTDVDCSGRSTSACKVNRCDLSSHRCVAQNSTDGTACSSPSSGVCKSGSCVACISDSDCDAGQVCSSTSCIKKAVCGDGHIDSGEQCDDGNTSDNDACTKACKLNVCGDGIWNSDGPNAEQCELGDRSSFPDGRAWDSYSCTASCRRLYVYTPCKMPNQANASDCGGGYCDNSGGGICLPACSGSTSCQPFPGRGGYCIGGGCAMECVLGSNDCPLGTTCTQSMVNSDAGGKLALCLP